MNSIITKLEIIFNIMRKERGITYGMIFGDDIVKYIDIEIQKKHAQEIKGLNIHYVDLVNRNRGFVSRYNEVVRINSAYDDIFYFTNYLAKIAFDYRK